MKIKKIFVKNYCSIKAEIVNFQKLLYPLVLVGENNVGKTNFLKALSLFFGNNSRDLVEDVCFDPSQEVEILIEFESLNDWEKSNIGENNMIGDSLFVRQVGINRTSGKKLKYYTLRKKEDEKESGQTFDPEMYKSERQEPFFEEDFYEQDEFVWFMNPSGSSNILEGYLPKFLYISAIDDVDNQLKVQTTTLFGEIITEIVRKLEGGSDAVEKIKEGLGELSSLQEILDLNTNLSTELQKIFDDITFKFEIASPNFFKLIQQQANTVISDEVETKPKLKGEGVQRAIIFSIFKVYSDLLIKADTERSRSLIFAIEEPELYLHPHTQKVFLEVLKTIARGGGEDNSDKSDQIVYTTHAPNLVEIREYESVCVFRKKDKVTYINQAQEVFPQGFDEDREKFRLTIEFDPERNELFFAKKVLLVEGDTEKISFRVIAEKMGKNLNKLGVSIVECGGKDKIIPFVWILNSFEIPYLVVCDEDPVEEIDLEGIDCDKCRQRANSKKSGQQSKFELNEKIQEEVGEEMGSIAFMSPDFEGLCESEMGTRLSKPFSAYKDFVQKDESEIPGKLKDIVEEVCRVN